MKLNSDLSAVAVVIREGAAWVPSPEPGVDRMMLERIGDEKVTRATTVVRYQPESKFSSHVHSGGEEFLVLEGVFSDVSGNFSQGFYVRNPVGSSHAPWSEKGTLIFVKLGQIDVNDKAYVRLDTNGADWRRYTEPGLKTLLLHSFELECVRLVSLKPGRTFPENSFSGGAEIFVVAGSLEVSDVPLKMGDWLRSPAGSEISIASQAGSTFYLKTGHLFPDSESGANC